ncbi:MAG: hypothetical protein KI788_15815 [Mameliella sp.]|nr:hypothetical protein [Mameliella sp.]
MSIAAKLNHIAPGAERVARIEGSGHNPSRSRSVWLGFSSVLVSTPVMILTHLFVFLRTLLLAWIALLGATGITLIWAIVSIVLGFSGKLEDLRDGE